MNHPPLRAVLAALLIAAAGAAHAQAAAPASAAAQDSVRPALATLINAGLELLRASRFQDALAKVAEAEAAAPDRTPYENFILDQLRGGAAAGAGDNATAVRSFEAALASGRLQGAEAQRIVEGLVRTSYQMKDWARTVTWGQRYLKDGGTNAAVRSLVVNAQLQQHDDAGAVAGLMAIVADDAAAQRAPREDVLRLLGSTQARLKDDAGYLQTLETLLRWHPKPAYWRDRVQRLQTQPGFDEALLPDSYRLLQAAGALEAAEDYLAIAELAQRAGLPAEAQQALDAGYAAGKLGTGPDAAKQQALKDRVTKDAAADAKDFDRNAAPPPGSSANALVNLGLALATSGRAERGIALVEQGLATPGLARPELARLRLGWIEAQAGQAERARAQFSALPSAGGTVAELARLWRIHLDRPAAR